VIFVLAATAPSALADGSPPGYNWEAGCAQVDLTIADCWQPEADGLYHQYNPATGASTGRTATGPSQFVNPDGSPDPAYGEVFQSNGDLNTAAASVLENPTFLADEPAAAAAAGTGADVSGLVALLQGTGAIAVDALPWAAGAIGAAVICDAVFSGCFGLFGSSSSDSPKPGWSWTQALGATTVTFGGYATTTQSGTTYQGQPAATVYIGPGEWYSNPQATSEDWTQGCGSSPGGVNTESGLGDVSVAHGPTLFNCGAVGRTGIFAGGSTTVLLRPGNYNRQLGSTTGTSTTNAGTHYCPATGSGCTASPVSTQTGVQHNAGYCLLHFAACGMTAGQATKIINDIAYNTPGNASNPGSAGGPTGNPFPVFLPDCDGLALSQCLNELNQIGVQSARINVVQTGIAGADLTKPADAVIETAPAGGSQVDIATVQVTVTQNPDVMPLVIPAPNPNETYQAYTTRLQQLGIQGTISDTAADDTELNPALGPDAVIQVTPAAGTRVLPSASVATVSNPDSANQPGTGGGATGPPTAPALPGISLPQAPTPCNVFPFGIPCWIANQLQPLNGGATAPNFQIGVPSLICSGCAPLSIDLNAPFGVPLSSIMAVIRPLLLFLSFLGLVYWLGGFALGGSTSGGGTAEATEE
jgi:hypothetical protein